MLPSQPSRERLSKKPQLFCVALLITIAVTKTLHKSRHPVSSFSNWTNHLDQIIYLMNFAFSLQTASKESAMVLDTFFNFLQLIFVTCITHCSICHLKIEIYILHLALSDRTCHVLVYTHLGGQKV